MDQEQERIISMKSFIAVFFIFALSISTMLGAEETVKVHPEKVITAIRVNPDFGQVEADPAQLNLSAFETYFEERRPFFIEGNTIFSTPHPDIPGTSGIASLFYSRRIGRQPEQFSIPDGSEAIDQPKSTTIISAVKLSGKTEKKTAFGIVDAVTDNEYADIERKPTDSITGAEQVKKESIGLSL
jgi:hypothetical protein